jgi:CHAT domain-containing protein/tetratricopeptide (TPR) repeat protein
MHPHHSVSALCSLHGTGTARASRRFATTRRRSMRRMILSAVVLLSLAASLRAQAPTQPDTKSLPTDHPIEVNIGGDEKHPYEFALNSDEFFQVHVAQIDVDILLRLLDGGSREVARMHSQRKYQSEETLTFVASMSGRYRLEVTALDAKAASGKYTIRREASRTATAQDRRRVEVERIFVEGMTAWAIDGQEETALRKFTDALAGWRELADGSMTDLTKRLVVTAQAYLAVMAGKSLLAMTPEINSRKALKKFEEARGLYHEIGEPRKEAAAILGMSQAAKNLKEEKIEIDLLEQALPLYSKPEDRSVKTDILLEIVRYYQRMGDDNSALEHLLPVQQIYGDLGQQRDAAIIASTIGAIYYKSGNHEQAYEFLNKALLLRKSLGDKCSELELLTNLGAVSLALGRRAEALGFLRDEAPPLYNGQGGCAANKPSAVNNLGKAYYDLGEYEEARKAYDDALKASFDNGFQAIVYNNLGAVFYAIGEYRISLDKYQQALELYKGDTRNLATTQTNIGVVHAALGHDQVAIAKLKDALRLRQAVGDKNGEAITLSHLSEVYLKLGDKPTALELSSRALTLFGAVNDPSGEAVALANAMNVARSLGNKRLAIFYGKQSVNKFQELRGAARGIEGELQKNYLRTVKSSYQHLAELLVEEGLFEQSILVLNLYQDEQFFDFNLDIRAPVRQVYLSTSEGNVARRYEEESKRLRRLKLQIAELERQSSNQQPGDAKTANLRKLQAEFTSTGEAFATVLKNAANELMRPAGDGDKNSRVEDVTELREALGKLGTAPGQKAVMLYTLVGNESFYVLLMTPDGVKAFFHPIKADAMNEKVKEFLTVLSCPDFDPFQESAALYNIIFKSVSTEDTRTTLEAELERYKPDLLLWSLGDSLNSIPMAALYDAERKQFLVEKYQHAVFTRARADRISRQPNSWIKGIGLGTSKAYMDFPSLPGVKESLSVIFGDEAIGRKGILAGRALVDEQFTRAALENLNGQWPLVHIASHFAYSSRNSRDSALLLGDGSKFRLSDMQNQKNLFAGVEFLVLSACETSARQTNYYGKEIEGFAELSQRLGANSVIATLWKISKAEAPATEVAFYRLYHDHQDWAKSEVLRQLQLSLLNGKLTRDSSDLPSFASTDAKDNRREGCMTPGKPRKRFTPDPKAPLAHPYYWAPFVLYGGSR